MNKNQIDDKNLKIIKGMLLDFFKDSTAEFKERTDDQISLGELMRFIDQWCEKHFK